MTLQYGNIHPPTWPQGLQFTWTPRAEPTDASVTNTAPPPPLRSARHRLCTAIISICLGLPLFGQSISDSAQAATPKQATDTASRESGDVRLYRTREEQRDAGLKRALTPWLTLSGLAEIELADEDFDARGSESDDSARESSASLQLGFLLTPLPVLQLELIAEYDSERDRVLADEAFVSLERHPWELSLGRQYTPFGVYFSNFASGPLLEFGETQAKTAATLAWGPNDDLDILFTLYNGRSRKLGGKSPEWNWAIAAETWLSDNWALGMSFQSDLSDADTRLLEEVDDRYTRRVAGAGVYLLWVSQRFEISAEALGATDSFDALAADRNRPWAWNLEVAHFIPDSNFELAFRIEGSEELEDAPRYQFGSALTWRAQKHTSLTLEYLHGEFSGALFTNENDQPYDHVDRIGALLSVEF